MASIHIALSRKVSPLCWLFSIALLKNQSPSPLFLSLHTRYRDYLNTWQLISDHLYLWLDRMFSESIRSSSHNRVVPCIRVRYSKEYLLYAFDFRETVPAVMCYEISPVHLHRNHLANKQPQGYCLFSQTVPLILHSKV